MGKRHTKVIRRGRGLEGRKLRRDEGRMSICCGVLQQNLFVLSASPPSQVSHVRLSNFDHLWGNLWMLISQLLFLPVAILSMVTSASRCVPHNSMIQPHQCAEHAAILCYSNIFRRFFFSSSLLPFASFEASTALDFQCLFRFVHDARQK